jgi:hypothetical protein
MGVMENTMEVIESTDYRYAIRVGCGEKKLYFLGLNPSSPILKDEEYKNGQFRPGETVGKIIEIANCSDPIFLNSSLWLINIYPQKESNVEKLHDSCVESEHIKNRETIKEIVQDNSVIFAMGGEYIERYKNRYKYFVNCLHDIVNILQEKRVFWKCFGRTNNRNPKHPARLNLNNLAIEEFPIEEYMAEKFGITV